jgi:hypothetical protein
MESVVFSVGNRVQILTSGPFRGLRGTIRTVHCLPPLEEPLCFYRIQLEGTYLKKAMWFRAEEVKLLSPWESLTLHRERTLPELSRRSIRSPVKL